MPNLMQSSWRKRAWIRLQAALLAGVGLAGCVEEPVPPGVDCDAHPSCSVSGPSCSSGDCISIVGCPSAICIDAEQACRETCGTPSCFILESFPLQIACDGREPVPGHSNGGSCDELEAERADELALIQACSTSDECGTELIGTSCGCTRNLVARADADLTRFNEIQDAVIAAECGGPISTCDCPAADGFACTEGRCTWNYLGL